MKRACGLFATISIFLLFMPRWLASQLYFQLRGIKEVRVDVEFLNEDAKAIGLTINRIETAAELRLRREGIKIVDKQDMETTAPSLYINIAVAGTAFNINVDLKEMVELLRDKNIHCVATTWEEGTTGQHGRSADYIVGALNEVLDNFLNDYYKANPRK